MPPTRFTPEPKKSRAITFAVCCLIAVVVWLYSRANPIAPYVAPTPDPATVSARFTQCLLPKAQYGEYSSYDGGKSAAALLGECVGVEDEWQKSCECAQCGFRTVRTLTSWLGDSMRCSNCEKSWDEHKPMLKNIRDAAVLLRTVSLQTKENMPFIVRIEIRNPEAK